MPRPKAVTFGPQTGRTLLQIAQQYPLGVSGVKYPEPVQRPFVFWEGVLTENLSPATNALTGPTSADCDLRILDGSDGNGYYKDTDHISVDVWNFDPLQIAFKNEYVAGVLMWGRYRVLWPGRRILRGVADSGITSGSSGTVSIYSKLPTGSLADTTINVTAQNEFIDIDSAATVRVGWVDDVFDIIAAECPA